LAEAQVDYQDFEKAAQGLSDINIQEIYQSLKDRHPEAAGSLMQLLLKDPAVREAYPVQSRLGSFLRLIPGFRGLVDNTVLGKAVTSMQAGPGTQYIAAPRPSVTPAEAAIMDRTLREKALKAREAATPKPQPQPDANQKPDDVPASSAPAVELRSHEVKK